MKVTFKKVESHDAELMVVKISATPTLKQVAYGVIFNDSRNRFPFGSEVRTSELVELIMDGDTSYLQTLNTVYKMVD